MQSEFDNLFVTAINSRKEFNRMKKLNTKEFLNWVEQKLNELDVLIDNISDARKIKKEVKLIEKELLSVHYPENLIKKFNKLYDKSVEITKYCNEIIQIDLEVF